jgi:hypothetical protein
MRIAYLLKKAIEGQMHQGAIPETDLGILQYFFNHQRNNL